MSDDYKVGYGKPPAKSKFQKGKSGNPSGRRWRRNRPEEALDFQKGWIAVFKSPITINEAGNKQTVTKWEALLMAAYARSLKDPAMMKYLLNLAPNLFKEASLDGDVYTYRVTQADRDLWEKIEEDVATWNSSEATKKPPED